MPISKGWTVVYKGERLKADLVAAALEARGLTVEIFSDNAYGVGVDLTEATIMVPDEQADAAEGLIEEAESQPPPELDEGRFNASPE